MPEHEQAEARKDRRTRRFRLTAVALAATLVLGVATYHCSEGSPPEQSKHVTLAGFTPPASFTALAKSVSPGVVNISASKVVKGGSLSRPFMSPFGEGPEGPEGAPDPFRDFFERFFGDIPQREMRQRSLGSGFVIDQSGFIITNNHVVEKADQIQVKLADGTALEAKVVGKDPKTDLALIKVEPKSALIALALGDSDKAEVGEWVVAIGNPFGLGGTVTQGIISAKGRVIGAGPYDDFIQTDASINPGNSGGPLLNMAGEVIGINTAIVSGGAGIGFAIPSNLAREILPQLKEKGSVTRGWIGVTIQEVTPELAKSFGLKEPRGALIADVVKGDPADAAGIKVGDVIVRFGDRDIHDSNELPRVVGNYAVGQRVNVTVIRNGKQTVIPVTIGKYPEGKPTPLGESETGTDLGMTVRELTPQLARQLGLPATSGLVVTDVSGGGLAAEAGIQPGDVIREINRKPVKTVKQYQEIVGRAKPGDTLLLLVQHGEVTAFRAITMPGG
jgi:serine protease Do